MTSDMTEEPRIGITVLGSGSKGNATMVHCGQDAILIDAGFSYRELARRLEDVGLLGTVTVRGILVTHEHSDHVKGLRVCAQKLAAPIFATRPCAEVLRRREPSLGGFTLIAAGGRFKLAGFDVLPFSIPHDANDPVAYTLTHGTRKIGIATDLGNGNHLVQYELKDCNALVLESNHDLNMLAASDRAWSLKQRIMGPQGHLSNAASAELLKKLANPNLQQVILAHISQDCNTAELAMQTAETCLCGCGCCHPAVAYASQDMPNQTVWL